MRPTQLRVLVVDDLTTIRKNLARIFAESEEIEARAHFFFDKSREFHKVLEVLRNGRTQRRCHEGWS